MEIKLDMREWRKSVTRLQSASKKTGEEFLTQRAKLITRDIIAITPPSNRKKTGLAAKRAGEAAIEVDLGRLFIQTTRRKEVDTWDLASAHRRARDRRTGRVKKGTERRVVLRSAYTRYEREVKRKVGSLAAGFVPAAAKLGYKAPAWIWRHDSPGTITVRTSRDRVRIRLTNDVTFAGDPYMGLERRLQAAVDYQAKRMDRHWRDYRKRLKRRSGF